MHRKIGGLVVSLTTVFSCSVLFWQNYLRVTRLIIKKWLMPG